MADLVLFSGGCDSTLVLYTRAMEILKTNQSYNMVKALSINHDQVPSQTQQQNARKKIKEEFIKRELPIEWLEVSISQKSGYGVEGTGLTQPLIWLPTAALYLRTGDNLYTGYHEGDHYWTRSHDAEIAMQSFLKVMDKKDVKIIHQLEYTDKASIIRQLKDRGLYELCWYCETPKSTPLYDEPCGDCTPCRTHRTALWQNETWYKDNLSETKLVDCCPKAELKKDDLGIAVSSLSDALKTISGS